MLVNGDAELLYAFVSFVIPILVNKRNHEPVEEERIKKLKKLSRVKRNTFISHLELNFSYMQSNETLRYLFQHFCIEP